LRFVRRNARVRSDDERHVHRDRDAGEVAIDVVHRRFCSAAATEAIGKVTLWISTE
jgi:hypothetical protein